MVDVVATKTSFILVVLAANSVRRFVNICRMHLMSNGLINLFELVATMLAYDFCV